MPVALDPDLGLDVATDAVARAIEAGADAAQVMHSYSEMFEVNFDTNDVTLVRSTVGDTMSIIVFDGTRKGSTQLTGRAHDAVDAAAAQALAAAQAGQEDAANVLPMDPAEPAVSGGDEEPDRDAMIDAVLRHIEYTKRDYPFLRTDSSLYTFRSRWLSYANSHGRTQHARRGRYVASSVVTGKDGERATSFNYADQISATPFADLSMIPTIKLLFDDTMAAFDARAIPSTFVGDVIFTPGSMGTIVGTVANALSGVSLMRKATPYLGKLGEMIATAEFTLAHRPSMLAGATPFDGDGFVNRDVPLITNGVLDNYLVDWYFANKLDRPMTTGCSDFVIDPGTTPLDEIIANTERGILLGRYSGGQPNANLDFSGVAKNSFYIDNGKVSHPINETMVAGNFADVMRSITAVSSETLDYGDSRFPWVATTGVTVSTK